MTLEEAQKVARVVAKADGGCLDCVSSLVDKLNRELPEFEWSVPDEWYEMDVQTVAVKERT